MADKIPVRDKQGRIIGYRGAGEESASPVFNPRPGLGGLARPKPIPAQPATPTPTASPTATATPDDEQAEKYRKMREDEAAEEAKEKRAPIKPKIKKAY